MKKLSIVFVFIFVFSIGGKAQMYLGIRGAYQFPALKEFIGYSNFNGGSPIESTFGKGVFATIHGGYHFENNISLDLEGSFLWGNKFTQYYDPRQYLGQVYYRPEMIRISPALRYNIGQNKFRTWMLLGPEIGIYNRMILTDEYSDSASSYYQTKITQVKGGVPIGIRTELGADWKINSHWTLQLSAIGIIQNWSPKKSTVVEWTVNGNDVLPSKNIYSKETVYVENPVSTTSGEPHQMQTIKYPFSSWGFLIGINYVFDKKQKTESN